MKSKILKRKFELELSEYLLELIDISRQDLSITNRITWFKEAVHHYLWCSKRMKEGYKFVIYNDEEAYEYNLVDLGKGHWTKDGQEN